MATVEDTRRRPGRRVVDLPNAVLRQIVDSNQATTEEAHRRLRETARDQQVEIERLQDIVSALTVRVTATEAAARLPVNIEKVKFSVGQLVVAVGFCVGMAAGMWRLDSRFDTFDKMQNERNTVQAAAMDQIRANLEMRRLEIQSLSNKLSDFMLQQQGAKR